MFFVFVDGIKRTDVIGAVSVLESGKNLAERRAKKELDWQEEDGKHYAEDVQGKVITTYRVELENGL